MNIVRSAARWRVAACSAVLAAVVASVAVPASAASAQTLQGMCLNAVPQQVYPGGAIDQ